MKLIKSIITMAAALAATVGYAGDSAPFRLDTMEGTRIAKAVETIAYSTEWDNAGKVIVAVDGVTLKEASAPASGDVIWTVTNADLGNHTLTLITYKNGVAVNVETTAITVTQNSACEFGIDDLPPKIRASLAYDANGFMIYNGWVLDYQNRSASEVTIPEGIVGIGRGAFKEMFDLETVTMPESLKYIASGAFEDCSWIQDLQFMSGLRYVGPVAFRGCSSLRRAMFADGVENLGTNVFEQCWQMKSVRLPFTVTNIGVRAFSGCSAIRRRSRRCRSFSLRHTRRLRLPRSPRARRRSWTTCSRVASLFAAALRRRTCR